MSIDHFAKLRAAVATLPAGPAFTVTFPPETPEKLRVYIEAIVREHEEEIISEFWEKFAEGGC